MLNEAPKKEKDYSNPTKWQLFWRIQGECWRRMITPFLMYLFMGLVALSLFTLIKDNFVINVVIDVVCLLCGTAFNAHLCYTFGKMHYDNYMMGCLHRRNALFGIQSGGGHHVEKEYRVWKGFLIGFLVGLPAVLLGGLAAIPGARGVFILFIMLITWWSYIPASWVNKYHVTVLGIENYSVTTLWCLPMIVLPVIVSGVFYIIGAYVNQRNRAAVKLTKEDEDLKR